MSEPLTSVLVPCHNSERWISQTIKSALAQEGARVEVIAVDDGSTDNTLQELRRFDPKIQVITTPNRGASAARNTAYRAAQGEFIQYLDADDLLAPGKIAAQLALARDDDRLLTFGSIIHFDDGSPLETGTRFTATLREELHTPTEFLIDLLGGNGQGWMVQTGQWLIPRQIAEQAGPWNETLSVDDDGEYFCRVVLAAREIAPCPKSVSYYRKFSNGRNLSAQFAATRVGAASQLASTRLKSQHLGRATTDSRAAAAFAKQYAGIAVQCYPQAALVSAEAEAEVRKLGCSLCPPKGTPSFNTFSRILGWKLARRMQHLAGHMRSTFVRK
ncbi:MAG: glycosyltransferase family 2 protein [Nibricoccus sp.]